MNHPTFFATPAKFRAWLRTHHRSATELWVGFHKKATGIPSITWEESVDEALCYGWIDGIRYSQDEKSYKIRFTPRNPKSVWSKINVAKMATLVEAKKMTPAGLAVFEKRDPAKTYGSAIERSIPFDAACEKAFRTDRVAWAYFEVQPPGYRRLMAHWVMLAKRAETRATRLTRLIEHSHRNERVPGTGSRKTGA